MNDLIWTVPGRSTRAIVDLDAIETNIQLFRERIGPRVRLMAVVKANGYGHGAVMVARSALHAGADELAVATVEEGVQLRRAGVAAPVLILGPTDSSEIETALAADLGLAVGDPAQAEAIARAARAHIKKSVSIHLKLDTGMHRYGACPSAAVDLARTVAALPPLHLAGTFTHFAQADQRDQCPTMVQFQKFAAAVSAIRNAGIDPGVVHAANSAATLRSRDYDCDLVRVGIALYGQPPSPEVYLWPGMRPALTIRSRIRRLSGLQTGDQVSYGGTYTANEPEQIALIPIGYADGYHRALSNRAWMGVGDGLGEIRGRICMDQTVIGLSANSYASVGDEVVVVGDGSGAAPTLSQLAELAGTIPYELATSLAPRVPRFYIRLGQIVAIDDLSGLRLIDKKLIDAERKETAE